MRRDENIVLIGMPGAGKSTVGVVLAKHMGRRFLDSDLVIQEKRESCSMRSSPRRGWTAFLLWKMKSTAVLKRMEVLSPRAEV